MLIYEQQNFQLIAIKESRDVEKLTRVSLLITKATILFLPVSMMTSYFGTQLVNTQYSVTTYWVAFVIVLVLSCVVLVGFGVMSGTMERTTLYQPIKRACLRVCGRREKEE